MNIKRNFEKRAKVEQLLLSTDYVEYGSHFFTPEQEEEMIDYRIKLREWDELKPLPTLPNWFPTPDLYLYIFRNKTK
jgi:hypothetical protein